MNTRAALCPICQGFSTFAFETEFHQVSRCSNKRCGHLFAAIESGGKGVMEPSPDEHAATTDYTVRNQHLIRYWLRRGFIRPGCQLLDFGSGTGHIVKSLKDYLSIDITCIEAGSAYHDHLRSLGCRVYSALDDLDEHEQFDSAIMIEVIEHLDDPVAILKKIRNRLVSGGRLFLSTPAGDLRSPLPDPRATGAYSGYGHVQFFTPTSLPYALNKAGFRRASYRFVNEMYPNPDMTQAVYESFWARRFALERQFQYWLRGCPHLTYFAS